MHPSFWFYFAEVFDNIKCSILESHFSVCPCNVLLQANLSWAEKATVQGFETLKEHHHDLKQMLMEPVHTSFSRAKQKKCCRKSFCKEIFFLIKELSSFAKLFCSLTREGCPSKIALGSPIFTIKHLVNHTKI